MATSKERLKPFLHPDFCKGCSRCVESCNKHCIEPGTEINAATGLVPVVLDVTNCNACGLCIDACPEPFGLDTASDLPSRPQPAAPIPSIPDERIPLPAMRPLVVKGTYASAIGAMLAGCRHFYGYPITPSTDGAELMAKMLPGVEGHFVQAVSEVATINHMYGTGGAGLRCMTFTSSPGFSLMLEGLSYMVGAEIPGVVVDVMRGGPGLGNIAPEQSDVKLIARGPGHGSTRTIALAPATPQEMLDLTMLAFDLAFEYRNPVIVVCDGYLGQITGRVDLPDYMVKPGLPGWAVWGDAAHRPNLHTSILLNEVDQEQHNFKLQEKFARMEEKEQRADVYMGDDADVLIVATNTPARTAKGAVAALRQQGIKAGLFRPITLWPFPIRQLQPLLGRTRAMVVVEASAGQLEDELRLALSRADVHAPPPITHINHFGGIMPQQNEIVAAVRAAVEANPPKRHSAIPKTDGESVTGVLS
ncbi:MAG: 3-methyl-2-oxobutanoate dehydrogenase subunit VorB [Deltaproteobacteria bacterium]|nr:3-methyl-2-oxobutanoate dehydrogenase subunit VorB [Deltaproteobacteria bacterium]